MNLLDEMGDRRYPVHLSGFREGDPPKNTNSLRLQLVKIACSRGYRSLKRINCLVLVNYCISLGGRARCLSVVRRGFGDTMFRL